MNNNTELILIRITGLDRPGLTASITEILSKYDVTILDIGQADIHSTLSLGILFKSQEKDSGNIMKELLFKASALGINIRFYPVTVEEYEEWVNMQGKNRYILTLLGRKLTAKQIAAVTGILAEQGLNIDAIKRLTGRIPLDERKANVRACIEFSVRGTPHQREEMQQALMKLSSDLEMDFSFQLDNMYRRMRRLICFDMDSTLIQTECIDELAERAGVGDQVREITERAMRGEIDFIESFTERVALLKGLDESVMKEIAENLPITEGVERLMFVLKRYGYKIAILSGGFTYNSNNREIYFIISELLSKGIDKDDIYRKVYNTYSESRLRLMGYVLSNMTVYSESNSALITLTKAEQSKFNYIKGDSEGFVNIPLSIKNVCFSCFLREDTEKPMIKISLRSVGTFPCNQLAAEFFHGGGHLNASGGEFFGTMEEAKAVFEKALEKYKPLLTAKS